MKITEGKKARCLKIRMTLLLFTELALNVQRESVNAIGAAVEGVGKEECPSMGHVFALDRDCRALHFITQTSVESGWRYSARMDSQNLPSIRISAELSHSDNNEEDREDSKISPCTRGTGGGGGSKM